MKFRLAYFKNEKKKEQKIFVESLTTAKCITQTVFKLDSQN